MQTEMQSQINKRILIFIIINIILIIALYSIPVENNKILENLCLYKAIFGIECWNCGMTRAFLSVLHLDFQTAMEYNRNVIFVFPITVITYLFSWYKYIIKGK